MIVKPIETGWEIIYQHAHGLLAAELALHWKVSERPPYFMQTLVAIAEHDDGLPDYRQTDTLTAAGAPLPFQFRSYNLEQCRGAMEVASAKNRWNALLTSHHLSFLYADKKDLDREMQEFLKQQRILQKKLTRNLGLKQEEVLQAYRFVECCDALSLVLCLDEVLPEKRRRDVSKTPLGETIQIWEDQTLRLEPWPFEQPQVEVKVEYRQLHQLKFKDSAELWRCLHEADVGVRCWTFNKS